MMKPRHLVALPLLGALALTTAHAAAPEHWVSGWAAPPIGYEPAIRDGLGRPFHAETVRQDIRVGVTGTTLRVRFSNELADVPLRIGAASIVLLDAAGKPPAGTFRALTFSRAAAPAVPPPAPMPPSPPAYPATSGDRQASV